MRRWIASAVAEYGAHWLERNNLGYLMFETSHSRCTPTELKAGFVLTLEAVPVNGRGLDLVPAELKLASMLTASLDSEVKVRKQQDFVGPAGANLLSKARSGAWFEWTRQAPTRLVGPAGANLLGKARSGAWTLADERWPSL